MLRVLLFVAGVMAAGAGMAADVAQCSADMVPIQIMTSTYQDSVIKLSATKHYGSDPHFFAYSSYDKRLQAFVATVTEHITARLAKDRLCLDSAQNGERSLLQFERWFLANQGDRHPASMPLLDVQPSGGGCRLTSPWMDLAFERRPVPWIRGIVRWNERQLLADQAVLAGAKNVPPGMAAPLTIIEFSHFLNDYANSKLHRKPVVKPTEERIPPDLLWLFSRSGIGDEVSPVGSVHTAMGNATTKGADGYTKLVLALTDRCLDANGATFQYSSILDAADLIPLDQYKITR